MKMEKKMWSTPMATVEQFAANEYVSACWGVECAYPSQGDSTVNGVFNKPHEDSLSNGWRDHNCEYDVHREGNCGTFGNQVIADTASGGFMIYETNSQVGSGTLDTLIGFGDGDNIHGEASDWDSATNKQINLTETQMQNGVWLYWINQGYYNNELLKWFHYGFVQLIDGTRAKHS